VAGVLKSSPPSRARTSSPTSTNLQQVADNALATQVQNLRKPTTGLHNKPAVPAATGGASWS